MHIVVCSCLRRRYGTDQFLPLLILNSLFHFGFSFSARSKSLVMGEQIGPPSRPSSPNPQERVVKCGWLKKQRSIMKNWQQRWFVLRGDQLFYYKDEEETKPQVKLLFQLLIQNSRTYLFRMRALFGYSKHYECSKKETFQGDLSLMQASSRAWENMRRCSLA